MSILYYSVCYINYVATINSSKCHIIKLAAYVAPSLSVQLASIFALVYILAKDIHLANISIHTENYFVYNKPW